jgi:hypothetical protein
MLKESYKDMQSKVEKALNSGCIDIESWDPTYSKMITPKTIVAAILKNESTQYDAKGTSFEKQVKKEINNIRLFI